MEPYDIMEEPQQQLLLPDRDYINDPIVLLQYDCATVAILAAVEDDELLPQLQAFSQKLENYAELAKANTIPTTHEECPQVQVSLDVATNDPKVLLNFDPPSVAFRTQGNRELMNQLITFASRLEHYATLLIQKRLQAAYNSLIPPETVSSSSILPPTTTSTATMDHTITNSGQNGTTNEVGRNPEQEETTNEEEVVNPEEQEEAPAEEEQKVAATTTTRAKRKVKQEDQGNRQVEQKAATTTTGSKRKRKDDDEQVDDQPAQKKTEFEAFWEELQQSNLRHSVGLSRKVISTQSEELGLRGVTHNSTVIKDDHNKICHLVLRHDWIDMSLEERQNLTWTMTKKDYSKFKYIHLLDPKAHNKPQGQLPIFLCGKVGLGPQKLFYIGHYRSVNLTMDREEVELEFKFVRFDLKLANKMSELAS